MDELAKFNNQTAGRDKVFRLCQYTSRIIWYTLSKRHSCKGASERAKKLDDSLGLMRRLLRFGRFYESLQSALPVLTSVSDPLVRTCCCLSRLSSSCFMLIDHIVCLDKLGILPPNLINSPRWDRLSTRFWLYSITLGLVRDIYEIRRIIREENRLSSRKSTRTSLPIPIPSCSSSSRPPTFYLFGISSALSKNPGLVETTVQLRLLCHLLRDHADVAVDTLKNLCDLCLPLNSLGFLNLSPATIGLLGVISTIASALPQINPMIKMVPAT